VSYTEKAWLENLEILQAQFSEAANKWTTPRACWFRFYHLEPLTYDQQNRYAYNFTKSIANVSAHSGDFVIGEEFYYAALLEGTDEQNTFFRELSVQTFDMMYKWPHSLPIRLDQVANGWENPRNWSCPVESPIYILWMRDNFNWRDLRGLGKLLAYVVTVAFTHARSTRWKRRREYRHSSSPIR
jgi:hypothetical protein